MSVLNKLEILSEGSLKTEAVVLNSGEVIVSQIGGADYINLYTDPKNQKKTGNKVLRNGIEEDETELDMARFTPALIAYSVVDEAGNRIFADDDIPAIARFATEKYLKLADACRKINGLSGEEVKNSEDSQNDSSFSDSV